VYAVIFRAKVAELNDEYFRMAERMKALAFEKYGCLDFVSSQYHTGKPNSTFVTGKMTRNTGLPSQKAAISGTNPLV